MHSILLLLFVTAPVMAALSLDIGGFVPFLLLFCVIAGLSTSPSTGSSGTRTSHKIMPDQLHGDEIIPDIVAGWCSRSGTPSTAGSNEPPRVLELARL